MSLGVGKTKKKKAQPAADGNYGGSTEDLSLVPGRNFYDVGGYKPVLKRINMGPKRCEEFAKMLSER